MNVSVEFQPITCRCRYLPKFGEAVVVDNLEPVHEVGVRPQFPVAWRVLR